jgi:hypothetical protein
MEITSTYHSRILRGNPFKNKKTFPLAGEGFEKLDFIRN